MIDGALGRLVQDQELGPHDQGAADRQLLLLAAGEVAALAAQHGLEDREQLEDVLRDPALAARQGAEAGLQILLDGEQGEDLAALRHQRDTAAGTLDCGQAGDVLALPLDPAGRGPHLPHDRAQAAGLADADAAQDAVISPTMAVSDTRQSAWLAP